MAMQQTANHLFHSN